MLICVVIAFVSGTLKKCIPDLFNVLCSDKLKNYAGKHASPEQLLRVIWEAGFWASPQFDSNKTLIIDCLLIIFIDKIQELFSLYEQTFSSRG